MFLAWDDGGGYHVYYSKSTDFGASFRRPSVVSDSVVGGIDPSIACDTLSRVYVVWGYGSGGVGITVSSDGGDSFPYPWAVPRSNFGPDYPSLTVLPAGQLYLTWEFLDDEDVLFSCSSDRGSSFSTPVNPSDTLAWANYATVTANERGRVFMAWSDSRNTPPPGTNGDIYFATGTPAAIQEKATPQSLGPRCDAFPNPSCAGVFLVYTLLNAGPTKIEVLDATGKAITCMARRVDGAGKHRLYWDSHDKSGRAVGAGIYFIRVQTPTGSSTKKVQILRE